MRIGVVFDTPYEDSTPAEHMERMKAEMDGRRVREPEMEYQVADALARNGHEVTLLGVSSDPAYAVTALRQHPVDLVFNAAEGFANNDQLDFLMPALLEASNVPFTGAPPQSLMLTRDKAMSKKVMSHHGVKVPRFVCYRLGETVEPPDLEFPLIVKPLATDASLGISQASIVRTYDTLAARVGFIHERFGEAAIVEEFIEGRELYVSIIGNGEHAELLPPVELVFDKSKTRPEERIATRFAKWDDDYRKRHGIKTVFARRLSKRAKVNLHEACLTAYRAMWLRDYARFDVRLDKDDNVWILEANANPFISEGHELAKSAEKAGLKYRQLIERIISDARARYH